MNTLNLAENIIRLRHDSIAAWENAGSHGVTGRNCKSGQCNKAVWRRAGSGISACRRIGKGRQFHLD